MMARKNDFGAHDSSEVENNPRILDSSNGSKSKPPRDASDQDDSAALLVGFPTGNTPTGY